MADIVNLKNFKKHRVRVERSAKAAENRIKFGQTKAKKQLTAAEMILVEKQLDGHKRED